MTQVAWVFLSTYHDISKAYLPVLSIDDEATANTEDNESKDGREGDVQRLTFWCFGWRLSVIL